MTSIGDYAFYECSGLSSINIPESVTSVGEDAFKGTAWYKAQSSGIVYLDNWALGYQGYSLTGNIVIKDGTKGIATTAFYYTDITGITLPKSIVTIGTKAFYGCTELESVYCYAENVPTTSKNVFSTSSYQKATLYVPATSINAYKSTTPWSEFDTVKITEEKLSPSKPGDVNGDGAVDVADIAAVISIMAGVGAGLVPARNEADVNGDGTVDVADIASVISIMAGNGNEPKTPGYYQIPSEYLNGWDEGVVTISDYYLVMKRDDDGQGYVAYVNDKENSTLGLAIYFDDSFNITEVVSEKGALYIDERYVYYVDMTGNLVSSDEINEGYTSRRNEISAGQVLSQIGRAMPVLNTLVTWIGRYNTARQFFAGNWEAVFNGIGTDLAGTLVGTAIGGIPGAIIGLGIAECFNILNNRRQQLDEASVNLLLGSSQVKITKIQRTGIYSYDITLAVSGLDTRPTTGSWSNKPVDVMTGVYIRENYPTVTHRYKTGQSDLIPINVDGTKTVSVNIDNPKGTYYVAPVLIPYSHSYPLTGYIRYGAHARLEGDLVSILNVKKDKCTYFESSNEYAVEASIDSKIVSTNGVASWGVEIYSLTTDFDEPKTLKAPSSGLSCTLKYQDFLSEDYLDSSSKSFKLRAAPFAIGTDNDKYYGKTYDFEIKADGLLSCPDENHPHWIDLGIGTQWRCCNEGASRPEDYGGYYQFGQVASAPTLEQIKALVNNCSYTWTTQNGVKGGKFTGPNGGTIFLPAAGGVWDGELYYVGSYGLYWSSTPDDGYYAYYLGFNSGYANWLSYWDSRHCQLTVRPVR